MVRDQEAAGSSPATPTTSEQSPLCSDFFFAYGKKEVIRPLPCSSFSAKGHARLACSVASALTTVRGRYHPFAGACDRNGLPLPKIPPRYPVAGFFPQGALPPMWRKFSPLRSKNSLFSPTGERRQMPFGLPTRDGFPFIPQPDLLLWPGFLHAAKTDPNGSAASARRKGHTACSGLFYSA